jgi:hypothetical protein
MPFVKGQSGNPGGRVPLPPEIREMARMAAPDALQRACELTKSSDENVALKAIGLVLDRAYGKPAQPIDGDGEGGAIPMAIEVRFVRPGEK